MTWKVWAFCGLVGVICALVAIWERGAPEDDDCDCMEPPCTC